MIVKNVKKMYDKGLSFVVGLPLLANCPESNSSVAWEGSSPAAS